MRPERWPSKSCRSSSDTPAARSLRPNVCLRSCTRTRVNPARLRACCHPLLLIVPIGRPRYTNTYPIPLRSSAIFRGNRHRAGVNVSAARYRIDWSLSALFAQPKALYEFRLLGSIVPPTHFGPHHFNRLIETKVAELSGIKSLYSEIFYDRSSFDRIYGGDTYHRLQGQIRSGWGLARSLRQMREAPLSPMSAPTDG